MHASLVNGTQLHVNHGTKYKVQFKTIDDQIYTEPPIWPKMLSQFLPRVGYLW